MRRHIYRREKKDGGDAAEMEWKVKWSVWEQAKRKSWEEEEEKRGDVQAMGDPIFGWFLDF